MSARTFTGDDRVRFRTQVARGTDAIARMLREGLFTATRRTSPNMAYYDPRLVERVRTIKALQGMLDSARIRLYISGLDCSGKVKKVLSRCQNGAGRLAGWAVWSKPVGLVAMVLLPPPCAGCAARAFFAWMGGSANRLRGSIGGARRRWAAALSHTFPVWTGGAR